MTELNCVNIQVEMKVPYKNSEYTPYIWCIYIYAHIIIFFGSASMSNYYTTYLHTNNLSSQSVHYKKQLSSTLAGLLGSQCTFIYYENILTGFSSLFRFFSCSYHSLLSLCTGYSTHYTYRNCPAMKSPDTTLPAHNASAVVNARGGLELGCPVSTTLSLNNPALARVFRWRQSSWDTPTWQTKTVLWSFALQPSFERLQV